MNDPYSVLGIPRTATQEEAAAAYRKLAKKYHPDLNPGDETAAKKMSEINAAYDAIKNGTADSYGSSGSTGGYSGGYPGGAGGYYGDPFGGFGDFGGFGGFGGYGGYGGYGSHQPSPLQTAAMYINAGRYTEALNILNGMKNKSAKWYYYSAIANSATGNSITALNHARIAVNMEPANPEYTDLLHRLESGGQVYRQRSSSNFGGMFSACARSNPCLMCLAANCLLNTCCYGGGMGYGGRFCC